MKTLPLRMAALAALALATSHGAFATTIAGSATFSDTTNNNKLVVVDTNGGSSNMNYFNISSVTVGTSYLFAGLFDFCTYLTANQTSTTTLSDSIYATFNISQPAIGSGTLAGTASETDTVSRTMFGTYDTFTGSVTWNNPLQITLKNSQTLTITLDNIKLTPSNDCSIYDVCGKDNAYFTLNDPKPVPEPATLALLGGGLLGLGYMRRRSNA